MRGLSFVLIVALASSTAHADDLADAKRLEAALEYEQALAIVDRAIAGGGADPDRLAELHLLGGKLAAGLDRGAAAEDHFARLLALRPDAVLPEGTSPKLTAPFEAARARAVPMQLAASISGGIAMITATADPLGMAVGIRVTLVDAAGHRAEVADAHALRVALPASATAIELAALDDHGNRVWVAPAPHASDRTVAAPPPVHPIPASASRPMYARWSTWVAAGGVALVAGGLCAWQFGVAQDDWNRLRADPAPHDYSELRAVEDRGNRWALAANLSFGVAAATALTATLVYLTHRSEPPIAVTATPTSIAIAAHF